MTETVEQFLARGGEIESIPRGAMVEAGWKPATRSWSSPESKARSMELRASRGEVEAAERKARKAAAAAVPAPNKPERQPKPPKARSQRPDFSNRNGYDGSKTRAMLKALEAGWQTARQISDASGQPVDAVSARMNQLRERGVVMSHGKRPRLLWALPGAEPPATPAEPAPHPNEFDGHTNLELLGTADVLREEIRKRRKLIFRIERELKRRKQACR